MSRRVIGCSCPVRRRASSLRLPGLPGLVGRRGPGGGRLRRRRGRGRRRPAARDLPDPGQRLAVHVVRVEPAQLLGQAVRHACAGPARSAGPAARAGAACPSARPGAAARPGPERRSSRTETIPAPSARDRRTFTPSRPASQPAMRSVDGEIVSPVTVAEVTASCGGKSRAAASSARQWVSRVHARSVSPAAWFARRCSKAFTGFFADSASVIRRAASLPMASVDGHGRGLARPPRHHRGVGQQQRHHHAGARLVRGERAVAAQHDDLAGPGVAADPDLRVQPGGGAALAAGQHDHAARVLAARGVAGLDGPLDAAAVVGDDHQRQHPAEREHTAALAQVDELLVDRRDVCSRADRRSPQRPFSVSGAPGPYPAHGLRQCRPVRASIRSADTGPSCRPRTGRGPPAAPPSARSPGRGSPRTARPPRSPGTATARRAARRGSAARRPPGRTR